MSHVNCFLMFLQTVGIFGGMVGALLGATWCFATLGEVIARRLGTRWSVGIVGALVLIVVSALVTATECHAGELSIVPEVGVTKMSSAPDDFWYEQGLPHTTDFTSATFGASLRYDVGNVQVSVGWRNLGNQHQSALIIADDAYFACRGHASACPRPSQYWTEGGSEQQTYAEVGYKFKLSHGYTFEPSAGLAETRIVSHVDMYFVPGGAPYQSGQSETQHLLKKFFGLTVQKGNVGVGVYLLDTEPNRYQNSWGSPIQGSSAVYARLTYAFKVVR